MLTITPIAATKVKELLAEEGRDDIALYTGNDDNIIADLLTPPRFDAGGKTVTRRIVGGLLGHWAVWTKRAVELLGEIQAGGGSSGEWLARNAAAHRRHSRPSGSDRDQVAIRCGSGLDRVECRSRSG